MRGQRYFNPSVNGMALARAWCLFESWCLLDETRYLYCRKHIILQLHIMEINSMLAITCLKSTIETLDQGLKYVQS